MSLFTPSQAAKKINVSKETLRLWSEENKIRFTTTKGGHHRYIIEEHVQPETNKRKIIYARVSSQKQQQDLERQIEFLQTKYPSYEIITDIASGLNFKRQGLCTILELLPVLFLCSLVCAPTPCKETPLNEPEENLQHLVVSHRDKLLRFGFELIEFWFKQHGSVLTVLEDQCFRDPVEDLKDDLLAIITFFTAKYYGSRKYRRPIKLRT
ncbi:hypothetical protein DUNSADRAFT_715 [Dunaliella salina]|uniref:Resolvase/invertase-type recombinase catalytic domain-containing protein n=1 Tax=Dunaliella salina TaxID=3046 RepID=A0ABQ7FYF8_DUNSA|nr:hypothetical protein DUNSADRAFT_715 [Dunaliella salina]|eukprot:KAF5827403.1 hypothetical protein DUNSADRAFT_715 [Dunaliella salina]